MELKGLEHYYEDGKLKNNMTVFEVLQLPEDFFNPHSFNEQSLKNHAKALRRKFHSDKHNTESERQKYTEVFSMIEPLIKGVLDTKTRKQVLSGMPNYHPEFDVNPGVDVNAVVKTISTEYDALERQLDSLLDKTNLDTRAVGQNISFEGLVSTLKSLFKKNPYLCLHHQELINKFPNVLLKLSKLAKTGKDFALLANLVFNTNDIVFVHRYGYEFLSKAASRGDWVSMRQVAGQALSGFFDAKNDSIIWALNCIRYMESVVIPHLQAQTPRDVNLIEKLQSGLQRTRQRIDGDDGDYGKGKLIPAQNTDDFAALVDLISKKLEGGTIRFMVPQKVFETLGVKTHVDAATLEELEKLCDPLEMAAEVADDADDADEDAAPAAAVPAAPAAEEAPANIAELNIFVNTTQEQFERIFKRYPINSVWISGNFRGRWDSLQNTDGDINVKATLSQALINAYKSMNFLRRMVLFCLGIRINVLQELFHTINQKTDRQTQRPKVGQENTAARITRQLGQDDRLHSQDEAKSDVAANTDGGANTDVAPNLADTGPKEPSSTYRPK